MLIIIKHLSNIKNLHGNVGIRIPNRVFKDLFSNLSDENDRANVKQIAFSYSYLLIISFLYRYTNFVDIDNKTYVQNGDIKEVLGYNRITKTIDKVIKDGGVLDSIGLTRTIRNYPVSFDINKEESINGIDICEFSFIDDFKEDNFLRKSHKDIVKNRNYTVKKPLFIDEDYHDNGYGTLYNVERTHRITITELITLLTNDELDNIDLLLYCFLKSKCKGYNKNVKAIAFYKIRLEIGISNNTLTNRLKVLEEKKYISIRHKKWKSPSKDDTKIIMNATEYRFFGIRDYNLSR